jgi:outer membrane protein assembly factor BamB
MAVLEHANVVVVIISPGTLSSAQVDKEIIWSHESQKSFAPLLIDISYPEFRERRPDWAMMMGAAVALAVPPEGLATVMPRLIRGIEHLLTDRRASHGLFPASHGDATVDTISSNSTHIPYDRSLPDLVGPPEAEDSTLQSGCEDAAVGERWESTPSTVRSSPVSVSEPSPVSSDAGAQRSDHKSDGEWPEPQGSAPVRVNRHPRLGRAMLGAVSVILILAASFGILLLDRERGDSHLMGDLTSSPPIDEAQAPATEAAGFLSNVLIGSPADASTSEVVLPSSTTGTAEGAGRWVPMARGNPARTGEMPGPMPDGALSNLWDFSVEPVANFDQLFNVSEMALMGDTVYVGTGEGRLYALDLTDGTVRWSAGASPANTDPAADALTVVVANGVAYFGSDAVYAVDAQSGTLLWRVELGVVNTASLNIMSLILADDIVFVSKGWDGLVALDATSGAEIWRASDVIATSGVAVENGAAYVAEPTGITAFDAESGAVLWSHEDFGQWNAPPTVVDGVVYLGLGQKGAIAALDAATGKELWRTLTNGWVENSDLIVSDGTVYAMAFFNRGRVYALDASSGAPLWSAEFGVWGFPPSWVKLDDILLVADGETITAVDAGDGSVLWWYLFAEDQDRASSAPMSGVGRVSTPLVVDGLIFVLTPDRLIAIGAPGDERIPDDESRIADEMDGAAGED